MKENIESLEKELNRIIDVELAKDVSCIDVLMTDWLWLAATAF